MSINERCWVCDKGDGECICRNTPKTAEKKKEAGSKFDAGKPPISLIPRRALEAEAMVMEHGRKKYDAHNWREGISFSRLYDGILRHVIADMEGEDLDPESGLSHAAHARCGLAFLLELKETHPELDDRYKGNQRKPSNSKGSER